LNACYEVIFTDKVRGAAGGVILDGAAAPAYCASSTAVSATGAGWLSGEMADDKWPNGIGQD